MHLPPPPPSYSYHRVIGCMDVVVYFQLQFVLCSYNIMCFQIERVLIVMLTAAVHSTNQSRNTFNGGQTMNKVSYS